MNKKVVIGLSALAIIILVLIFSTSSDEGVAPQKVSAERGPFEIVVTITGELQAKNRKTLPLHPS